MKKSLLALSLTALLFSCKKETETAEFTPTDLTGTAHVKGNTTKNVVTSNGTGGWTSTSRVPAAGVNVTVRILKSSLYPNSNAQGADVYTGTTDANGNYDITVKSNGNGVSANITIDGFSSYLDTVKTINGAATTIKGLPCLYVGTAGTANAFNSQNTWFGHNFTASNIGSNPNNINIGTAIVTGSVSMNFVRSSVTGTNAPVLSTTNVVVPAGTKVWLDLNMDPTALATKNYMTTTDAAGGYTFNISTVAAGTAGFTQNATIWIADYTRTRDTVKVLNGAVTGTVTGSNGVYNNTSTNQNGVFNNEIRNATNLNYGTFIPN